MNLSPVIFLSLFFSEAYNLYYSNRIWGKKLVDVGYLIEICVAIFGVWV
jgi:hypothetical protein